MLFNSLPFLVFLPVFLAVYFARRGRARLLISLVGSYFFYGWWDWRFLSLIALSTVVDYFIAAAMRRPGMEGRSRRLLVLSVVVNLGILGLFKYFNFFADSFVELARVWGAEVSTPTLDVILPVGISFYTFQTMSYTIDVYRGNLDPEPDFLRFATYVAFFPQLVAGPIVRAKDLLPQLRVDHGLEWERLVSGLGLVVWGFFKKVVVADSLAIVVDGRFGFPEAHSGLSLAVGVVFYAFQIYADFSGYSDIAIGVGRMLGYDFGINFRRPYFSTGFSEFWRRWHISLSSWLRDYLYISLGGNRGGTVRTYRNLMLTMLLGGLWHGANWTFVIWGGLHGSYLVVERLLRRLPPPRLPSWLVPARAPLAIAVVFSLTCLAWVFFRAETLADALYILDKIVSAPGGPGSITSKFAVVRGALVIGLLLVGDVLLEKTGLASLVERPAVRLALSVAGLWAISLLGTFHGTHFVYFQF